MDFSNALRLLKDGHRVQRACWPLEQTSIFLVAGSKFAVNRPPLNRMFTDGTPITYRAHIDQLQADGSITVWTPTVTDLLSDDWLQVGAE